MMCPLIIFLLSGLAIVAASPVFSRQACSAISPTRIFSIVNSQPDTTFPGPAPPLAMASGGIIIEPVIPGPLQYSYLIAQRHPGTEINPQVSRQAVEFNIPANANTCQIFINDTESQLIFEKDGIATAPAPAINVISLVPNADIQASTWNSIINASPSVIESLYWSQAGISKGGFRLIGDFPCSPGGDNQQTNATFLLEIDPNQIGPGSSDWILPQNLYSDEEILARSGVYVTYCLNWN